MATKYLESGSAATQGFEFWATTVASTNGAWTSDAQAVANSVRSVKFAASGGTSFGHVDSPAAILADAGRRFSLYWRASAFGNAATTNDIIAVKVAGSSSKCFYIGHTTSGGHTVLCIIGGTGSIVATGTTALSVNTDYRISVAYTITDATHSTITLFLNGIQEATVTNAANIAANSNALVLSACYDLSGAIPNGGNWYYAHIYVDDGTTGDTGDIHVTAKRPFSNGSSNQWTTQIGSGGSGYGSGHAPQVNERPLSTTNGWSIQNAATQTEEYSIEAASAGDVDISAATLVDFEGWLYEKVGVNSTGNLILTGTTHNISVTTAYSLFTQIAGSTTYPAGSTDIGADTNSVNQLFSLAEAGIIFAYTPGGAASPIPSSISTDRQIRATLGSADLRTWISRTEPPVDALAIAPQLYDRQVRAPIGSADLRTWVAKAQPPVDALATAQQRTERQIRSPIGSADLRTWVSKAQPPVDAVPPGAVVTDRQVRAPIGSIDLRTWIVEPQPPVDAIPPGAVITDRQIRSPVGSVDLRTSVGKAQPPIDSLPPGAISTELPRRTPERRERTWISQAISSVAAVVKLLRKQVGVGL